MFYAIKGFCISSRLSSKIEAYIDVFTVLILMTHMTIYQDLKCEDNRITLFKSSFILYIRH